MSKAKVPDAPRPRPPVARSTRPVFTVIRHSSVRAEPARVSPIRGEPIVAEKEGKEIEAFYVGDTPPRIDGHLDDEVWQTAQAIDDMVQNDPNNMQPPTERTVVKDRLRQSLGLRRRHELHARSVEDHDRARPPRHVSAQRLDQDHVRSAPRSPDRLHLRFEPARRAGRHDVVRRHALEHRLRRGVGSAHADRPKTAGPRNSAFRSRSCASRSRRARPWSGASTSAATSSTTRN